MTTAAASTRGAAASGLRLGGQQQPRRRLGRRVRLDGGHPRGPLPIDGNTTDADGGAIYADEDGDVTVIDSTVNGSDADGPGGAVFTLDGDDRDATRPSTETAPTTAAARSPARPTLALWAIVELMMVTTPARVGEEGLTGTTETLRKPAAGQWLPCSALFIPRRLSQRLVPPTVRDNTVTTNAPPDPSRSSITADERLGAERFGRSDQAGGKVEGLVLLMRGGSSSLPGRISLVPR